MAACKTGASKFTSFCGKNGKKIIPYQISWDGIKERQHKALDEFYDNFPKAEEAQFITRENIIELLKREVK